MAVDHIRYDLLTQDALRGVLRTVLTDVAVKGLPGEHHFFITFDTRIGGVRLSARLKASYPEEMTIVLQHQFWDLTVGDDDFAVGLAFNAIPERLHIPFKAVKAFLDPSVPFGLQFVVDGEATGGTSADVGAPTRAITGKPAPVERTGSAKPQPAKPQPAKPQPAKPQPAKPPTQPNEEPVRQAISPANPAPVPAAGGGDSSAEVVRLDRFRKK
jgi:uncharacterized protein